MRAIGLVAVLLLGLIWPQKISAAFYISGVSGTTINSADEEITISATASGLTTSPQYFQAVFTKKDDTTNYFGFTQNLSGEWYSYKSSPILTDLQNYFYKLDFSGASWSGQLKTKIDTSDDGFKGPGIYLLKLLKHITGSGTASNNSYEININVASVSASSSSDSSNNDSTPAPDPAISWVLPTTGKLGENFKVTYSLKDFPANTDYYVKVRGAQTKNGNNYLSENETWTGFPSIKIKDNGGFDGEVYAFISDEKDAGDFACKLRFRKKDSDSFVESESKKISLAKVAIAPVVKNLKTASNSALPSTVKPVVLGTKSADLKPASVSGRNYSKPTPNPASFLWPVGLIVAGLGFIGASVYPVFKEKFFHKKALEDE